MLKSLVSALLFFLSFTAHALEKGQKAPLFKTKNQDGVAFDLKEREGKGWTVLYFYPKAETPGCTKQACAFRDSIKVIEKQNAKVFGVSTDSVEKLAKFKAHHKLTFDLLSDEKGEICESYGTKWPILKISKRHTFILDPTLVIRYIDQNVDPVYDAKKVADELLKLQSAPQETKKN